MAGDATPRPAGAARRRTTGRRAGPPPRPTASSRSRPPAGERPLAEQGGHDVHELLLQPLASRRARASSWWSRCCAVLADRGPQLGDAVAGRPRSVATTGGRQPSRVGEVEHRSRSRRVSSTPGRSALLITNTSAISSRPALFACTASPQPGFTTTTVVSAAPAISTSTWPTPTVSIEDPRPADGVEDADRLEGGERRARRGGRGSPSSG